MWTIPILFGSLIGVSVLLLHYSRVLKAEEHSEKIRRWFGIVRFSPRQGISMWKNYLTQLSKDAARVDLQWNVKTLAKITPLFILAALVIMSLLGLPLWISVAIVVLLIMFPRLVLRELASRNAVRFRKELLKEAIPAGLHALGKTTLEQACLEIETNSISKSMVKEFHYVNRLGSSPGMTVSAALVARAKELGITEYKNLAILTYEGEKRNANLNTVWKDTESALARFVNMQNTISAETSIFRLVAIVMFVLLIGAVLFGYRPLHIHGLMQLGVLLTLIMFFIGTTRVLKVTDVD